MKENYFLDNNFEENDRRDIAFQLVNALREVVSISKKMNQPISYEQTLDLLSDFSPETYEAIVPLMQRKNESDWVKYFKEKADALSTDENIVSPITVINEELAELKKITKTRSDKRFLNKRVRDYENALDYFSPRKISEHKILNRDFYLAERTDFKIVETLYEDEEHKDYRLDNNNILRLRLIHPDRPEHIIGADLIYEHLNTKHKNVRFLHMQYKTWNNKILNFKAGNLEDQINKLDNILCKAGYCNDYGGKRIGRFYRLPYCCAFLRPTSKMQNSDSKMVSTGMHIPICEAKKIMETEKSLTKENIKGKNISYKIFDELFNSNMIGSRVLNFDEHQKFYEDNDLLDNRNIIRIHAQEIML
ncbi:hypothetical protein QX233_15575 [Chryseobacterium gambrini]|uniref:Uncharacterized protein n=1 Tax=Chryseobacterium gambrini TaxID=373672 RepID=A0AAJ1VNI2_9FLAO|nr:MULTISPECIES: hypothetical protein [Chryseobacterium]MDN4013894.1 hypothetical protein [Chryseobacterium gambrini]QWA39613.1 hypothetical protein KKI44_05230 [Chryseobacterium sp. ZHDP1]